MKGRHYRILGYAACALTVSAAMAPALAAEGAAAKPVYFRIGGAEPKDTFIIKLTDQKKIDEAREILRGSGHGKHGVMGIIVVKPATYNKPWHFHLAPESISFFEVATEVCDASTSYVEEHLSEVGTDFLPGNHWCPWSSKILAELPGAP